MILISKNRRKVIKVLRDQMVQHWRTLLICLTSSQFWGCSSVPEIQISTDPVAEVIRINPDEGIEQKLGSTPIRISDPKGLYVMTMGRKGYVPEFFVIPAADEVQGEVKISLSKDRGSVNITNRGRYIDRVSRAHRLFLRGLVADAKALLDEINRSEPQTYATLLLRANIALAEGRTEDAAKFYQQARELLPDRPKT